MEDATLMHYAELTIGGAAYPISVYCREDGKYFALTQLAGRDIVISDGKSLEEALMRHQGVLPLAVGSRMILREFRRAGASPLDCSL